ncbi:MAG: sodium:solute symporter family protein, partial [Alphaproteobacteria bacterium]|nr:sodium:solute symporter family protein [Alphaproteobacteria bacterium]
MIDVAVVVAYLILVLAIGLVTRRAATSIESYAVVGRSYGSLVIFATMSASFIGGGFSIGNAEKVFLLGIANIVGLWGFSLKEILVARYIAPRMDRFPDAISIGDIMATRYGLTGRVVSGVFALLLCTGIVGAQVGAIGVVFNVFLGFDVSLGIAVGCGAVILYTTMGGMRAVVMTDLFQFAVLAVGIPMVLVFGVIHVGGADALIAAVPEDRLQIPGAHFTWLGLIALFLAFLLGETLVPPYVQRLLIGKTAANAARGTLFSGLFSIPFFTISGLIGLVALAMDPNISSNLALPHVVVTVMPPVLKGLVIAGVISVVMSSADSFLNSASIAFVNDLVRPFSGARLSERRYLQLAKLVTLTVGLLSVFVALTIEGLLDILIFAYTYWAPVIVVPLVAVVLG